MGKKRFLFICNHNAGRSQMAEAFFNRMADGRASAISAGSQPASEVNSLVIAAMREAGIDISRNIPRLLTGEMLENVNLVISMGCEAACPVTEVPSKDWSLEDPEGKSLEEVRAIRDAVKAKVAVLVKDLDM
jgi:arsenate reductase (thioredoxin)